MDTKTIGKLINMLENSALNVMDLSEGDFHIRLEKNYSIDKKIVSNNIVKEEEKNSIVDEELPQGNTTSWEEYKEIKSPLVGVFKSLKAADKGEDVVVGQKVNKGDTICAIEAMKLINEIKTEYSGEVMQVLVKDGDAIEYGQVLFRIKED